jgi:hypothetical protein
VAAWCPSSSLSLVTSLSSLLSLLGGRLLPFFITVANGPVDVPTVARGNEAVLRARFEDAAFFYREDLKQRLEAFRWGHAHTKHTKQTLSFFLCLCLSLMTRIASYSDPSPLSTTSGPS